MILRFIIYFLLAPALAITTQAAGVDQGDFRVNDKGFREASGLLMPNSAIYAAHGEYIAAGFSALGAVTSGWAAARTATGSVAGLSSAYTTPKWHQGSVSASESVATNWSSTRFSGGATNKLPTPNGNFYSTAFETTLDPSVFGRSRSVHFNRANAALDDALRADAGFAAQMDSLIPGVADDVSRIGGRQTPIGWIWHHDSAAGVMQLVPEVQHTSGSIYWNTLHPGGRGGYSIWAIPNGAPKN